MSLRVRYQDGIYEFVNESVLTSLIEGEEITKFKRSAGWVDIDSPYVRKTDRPRNHTSPDGRTHYHTGPDRRTH